MRRIEFVILRYGLLYGPGTFYAAGGRMADGARSGRLVADDSVANFVHVDDAAAALEWLPGIVNIGDEPASAREWMSVFADAVGAPLPVRDGRAAWARGADNGHARQHYGWAPRVPSWRPRFGLTS